MEREINGTPTSSIFISNQYIYSTTLEEPTCFQIFVVLYIISLAEVEVVVGAIGACLGLVDRVSSVVTIGTSTSGVRGAIDRDTSRVGGDNLQGDIETCEDRDVIVVEVAASVHCDLEL